MLFTVPNVKISFAILFVVIATIATVVNATTSATLADELYAKLKAYGMTAADKVEVERYLADNKLSADDANAIMAKADEAVAIMDAAGVTNYADLSDEDKEQIKSIATEAADIAGVDITISNGTVSIYKDGKLFTQLKSDGVNGHSTTAKSRSANGRNLAYTGNSTNAVLVVSSVAVIALALGIVARKKLANA